MRFVADSSMVVRLYFPTEHTEAIERFLTEDEKVMSISDSARIEVLNVLLRDVESRAAARFEQDLAEGLRVRLESVNWPEAFQQAESLARRFSRVMKPGGHDLILVAAAVTAGAAWFLSFDRKSRQRPLAAVAGLRVWPALDKTEKGLVRHAMRQTSG